MSLIGLLGLITFTSSTIQNTEATTQSAQSNTGVSLPVGQKVFKITLSEAGIYEVSASDLIAKGMASNVNPADIQLMQYGEAVAWELISDPTGSPNLFDKNDKIRFYGWPFGADETNESRAEKHYVNDNVFWIIPGRSAVSVQTSSGAPASSPIITSVTAQQRFELDDLFSSMSMTENHWAAENAEPDHYFWLPLRRGINDETVSDSLTIDLEHPTSTGSPATISAVAAARRLGNTPGKAKMTLPNNSSSPEISFFSGDVFTLTQTIPNNALANGSNTIEFSLESLSSGSSSGSYYVNFVDVTFQRDLKGSNNKLPFSSSGNGNQTFELSNFTASSAADFVIWNVTDRKAPKKLNAVSAGGGNYRFSEAITNAADFFVASSAGVEQIQSNAIETYTPPNLAPSGGTAEWLAIGYREFIDIPGTTNDLVGLAAQRRSFSNLTTHVVDIEDVVNQFGYGFASSHAVKRYITHAYLDWSQPVRYVLLGGDGHYNPRHLACSQCSISAADFNTPLDSLIPVYHSYSDAFQGLIPSDFRYTLLVGDDVVPEVTIGRISAETTAHMQDAVSKIIMYEDNLIADPAWRQNMLFTHDWPNQVADNVFRTESEEAEEKVESHGFNATVSGLHANPSGPSDPAASSLRQEISEAAGSGISMLIWRGHGSINNWSNGDVMSVEKVLNNQLLPNIDKPFVSITHNCLDGNFAYPGWNGLGESLLRIGEQSKGSAIYRNTGSAAHFAATGLGFVEEHELISDKLFEAIFDKGLTRFGDAINFAKVEYIDFTVNNPNVSIAELYSYNLQGDPAMVLFKANLSNVATTVSPAKPEPSDLVTITFDLTNFSGFTASADSKFTFTLPKDLTYKTTLIDYSGPDAALFNNPTNPFDEPVTVTSQENSGGGTVITVTLNKDGVGGIPANGGVKVRVFGTVNENLTKSVWLSPFSFTSPGSPNQNGSVTIDFGGGSFIYLPIINR